MKKVEYFTSDDFQEVCRLISDLHPITQFEAMAHIANEKLQKMIDAAPVVYNGSAGFGSVMVETWGFAKHDERDHLAVSSNFKNSTKKARLLFIEPIKTECVKHEPKYIGTTNIGSGTFEFGPCTHCGAELTAVWDVKK